MPVLTAIDAIGVQSYIFSSNRLRDVIGSSYLVDHELSRKRLLSINDSGVSPPEVVMAAGGNAILKFDALEGAKAFVLRFTRRLLEEAPGLDVAVAHCDYDEGGLAQALVDLQEELTRTKRSRRPHAPQLGLSVMQPCAVSGLPACQSDPQAADQALSRQIASSRSDDTRHAASERWAPFLGDSEYAFPVDLDHLGRTHGDTSLIGIVHVDGNGVGERIRTWIERKRESCSNDEAVRREYDAWSQGLRNLGAAVLSELVNRVSSSVREASESRAASIEGRPEHLEFELKTDEKGAVCLPLRPIVLGGDDLTFVCDGRIALDLTAAALESFERLSSEIKDIERHLGPVPLTACAGVAIVRSHAPFIRSYQLCSKLCDNAKASRMAVLNSGGNDASWLDWHIGQTRPNEALKNLRARQYETKHRRLTGRPYPLRGEASDPFSWEWLDGSLLLSPGSKDEGSRSLRDPRIWGERRNKVKALATLLRQGEEAVSAQMGAWRVVDQGIRFPFPLDDSGFRAGTTPLYDGIELLDLHLSLDASPKDNQSSQERIRGGEE